MKTRMTNLSISKMGSICKPPEKKVMMLFTTPPCSSWWHSGYLGCFQSLLNNLYNSLREEFYHLIHGSISLPIYACMHGRHERVNLMWWYEFVQQQYTLSQHSVFWKMVPSLLGLQSVLYTMQHKMFKTSIT